jgi:hypothetical protein
VGRGIALRRLNRHEDAAKDWHLAMELADRGEFTLAKQMFERVQRHSPTG